MIGSLLYSQGLPLALGYVLLLLMTRDRRLPLTLGLALGYGLGNGILCQWMFALGILGIPYSVRSIGFPLGIVLLVLSFTLYYFRKTARPLVNDDVAPPTQAFNLFHVGGLVFLLWILFFVWWNALHVPVAAWDVLSTHGMTGKILFLEASLEHRRHFPHPSYPLHVPFLMSWIAFNLGQWHEQFVKIVSPSAFMAWLFVQYHFMKRLTNAGWALLSLLFLYSSIAFVYIATTGYREMSLAFYSCTTLVLILFWHRNRNDGWLYLAGLYAGFLSFVKTEGVGYTFTYSLILVFLLRNIPLSFKEKCVRFFKFFMPAVLITSVYLVHTYFTVFRFLPKAGGKSFRLTALHFEFGPEAFARVIPVLDRISENLFLMGNWNIVWLIFFVSFIVRNKQNRPRIEFSAMAWSVAIIFFIYFIGFTFTQHHFFILKQEVALTRSIIQYLPLIVMLGTLNFYSVFNQK